jgi:hypothetical protein
MMQGLISEKMLRDEVLKVSAVTVWTWRKQGRLDKLKTITIGDRRFYRPSDITAWMDELAIERPNENGEKSTFKEKI